MVLKWKNNQNVQQISTVIKGQAPRAFVEKEERWCPFNNAETAGNKTKLAQKLKRIDIQNIITILNQHQNIPFKIKDLINWQNANYLTDGSLQRKALSILACNGIIDKKLINYTNKQGKNSFYFEYKFIPLGARKVCSYMINGKCNYVWKTARTTRYFTDQ